MTRRKANTNVVADERPRLRLPEFEFNSDAQALTALDRRHKYIINLGGKGSGKTATIRTWAADRSAWDTATRHGIFTNTDKQLKDAVLAELFKVFPKGVLSDYGHKPPKEWIKEWVRNDIPIPPVADYRNYYYTKAGLHALCGTLSKQNYTQFETLEFASLRIEEIPALSREALKSITSRLRCGEGENCDAKLGHRHQAWLFGNPPIGPHKWLADWLDEKEEGSKKLYHSLEQGELCDGCFFVTETGKRIARVHGPILNHRQWPLLRKGIGDWIFIKSKTAENRKNLSAGYEDEIAMNSDRATAAAWLYGEYQRETGSGCYDSFSDRNVREVKYDPNRTLYVCCDINIEPRVAVLAHPLIEGEYPSDWAMKVEQLGAFGEFFDIGGMSDERFAESMVKGDRGRGDAGYPDDQLRGLPANWGGLANHKGPIILYGDGAGNIKSVHSRNLESSWDLIKKTLNDLGMKGRYSLSVPAGANMPARARIGSVNAKFSNSKGLPSLTIAPRCRHTIKDCEQVVWDEDGNAEREWRQGPERLRTHCMAGLGYMILQRHPFRGELAESVMPSIPFEPFRGPRMH